MILLSKVSNELQQFVYDNGMIIIINKHVSFGRYVWIYQYTDLKIWIHKASCYNFVRLDKRLSRWTPIDADINTVSDFPRLSEGEIRNLTIGVYMGLEQLFDYREYLWNDIPITLTLLRNYMYIAVLSEPLSEIVEDIWKKTYFETNGF